MNKLPKKAKLITDNGFSKIIKHPDGKSLVINYPIIKRIRYTSIELSDVDLSLTANIEFSLAKVYKKYAIYQQTGVINIIK